MRIFILILLSFFMLSPAHAQVATFDGGSAYDIDPTYEESTKDGFFEAIEGSNDMQAVVEVGETEPARKLARAIGRLRIIEKKSWLPGSRRKGRHCTASLIDTDLILTNYHCIPGHGGKVEKTVLTMGYLVTKELQRVLPRYKKFKPEQYEVVLQPVDANKALDYAVLRVKGHPGKRWGTVPLSAQTPGAGKYLFIIHHPAGYPQRITRGFCQTSRPAVQDNDIYHVCDTMGGSSGAPIFDNALNKVIGLHNRALSLKGRRTGKLNAGKRIASIAKNSPLIARLVQKAGEVARPKESAEVIAMRKQLAALKAEQQKWRQRKKPVRKEPKVAVVVPPRPVTPAPIVKPAVGIYRQPFEPEVVHIPGGTFSMGCVSGKDCQSDEKPVHKVTVSSFYLSKYETTVGQFKAFVKDSGHKMGKCDWPSGGKTWRDPGFSQKDNQPVVCVSWKDAVAYAKWLSRKTGQKWRLPTEAEWEYAARGDKSGKNRTKFHFGNRDTDLCKYGNVADRTAKKKHSNWTIVNCNDGYTNTASVGSFKPNGFGAYDMHGNVWEWVHDWKGKYKKGHQTDPKGPRSGSYRVNRGGGSNDDARYLRSALRSSDSPDSRSSYLGFRLLRQPS